MRSESATAERNTPVRRRSFWRFYTLADDNATSDHADVLCATMDELSEGKGADIAPRSPRVSSRTMPNYPSAASCPSCLDNAKKQYRMFLNHET